MGSAGTQAHATYSGISMSGKQGYIFKKLLDVSTTTTAEGMQHVRNTPQSSKVLCLKYKRLLSSLLLHRRDA
jgi:hypothetical protein